MSRRGRGHGGTGARRRTAAAFAVAALALGAAGCTTLDNAIAKVPWFTTMSQQVVVRPFEGLSREADTWVC